MGTQTMGTHGGGGDSNGKQSPLQPLVRQNSMYSLTLDEVQNQLGDLGKPLTSMNIDELLKNVWTAEASQTIGMDNEGTAQASQASLQRQASLSLTGALSKKTVDEVWRDIQQNKIVGEKKFQDRHPTLGEMTLEDFLVKAGVVAGASSNRTNTSTIAGVDSNVAVPQFPSQAQWIQYPQAQYQHPPQSLMGMYMPSQDTQTPGRKKSTSEDMIEKTVERRQKRMIKNRESAARSRARKQAYTNELENKVSRLEEENERLRKRKDVSFLISLL
ncbi:hypothetical protein GLYMA_08G227000v4 [Glycine max]|uniref:ABSCISIC ACID-INSENSITIVE 5-like protein 2 isoform D n=1 Tax=Glycine soja TaxID=3848 RepID=A0A445JIM1_GLYSO|nr:hypothetical protein GLYMA_08G227000v4 [Glycine max]KAH1052607.1 hypothetical protein GYH30_022094 [Glycine max]RZB98326.1 ABSCISIC ACID-INSENSITIVE 5-like protein 2 isoform D [Glycine soja]